MDTCRKSKTTTEKKYRDQKRAAKKRGIDFHFSFQSWCDWWEATGHFHERGNSKGQYVMARYGDTGPYKESNVKCVTCEENNREAHLGIKREPFSDEWKRKIGLAGKGQKAWNKGIPHSKETKAKMKASSTKGKKWSAERRAAHPTKYNKRIK